MRNFLYHLLAIAFIIPLINSCNPRLEADQVVTRPNFLFILTDDLGWRDLSSFGSYFYETPNIDRIAAGGTKFTQAYAACPVCSPTRSSIMTGKYPARTDNTDWFGAPQPEEAANHHTGKKPLLPAPYKEYMELDEVTIAEALKEAGYQTFFAGKWHLGPEEKYWPQNQGFDVNKGGWTRGAPNRRDDANGYFSPYGNPELEDGPDGEYLPLRLAEETNKFIEANQDSSFFAYLSLYSVHTPLMTTDELLTKYESKKLQLGLEDKWGKEGEREVRMVQCHPTYGGMVEAMDRAIGMVTSKLDELGLSDNTIIFFMSDNGGLSTSEGHPTANLPLRAGKGWLYEGGIREPMFINWPGVTKAGTHCEIPVTSTDFYPTILEMAGVPLRPEQHLDGVSLARVLQNPVTDSAVHESIFWHYPHYGNQGGSPGSVIRKGDWKLIKFYEEGQPLELYNLKEDISEYNNLADQYPERVQQMEAELDQWLQEVDAKFPSPNPNAG